MGALGRRQSMVHVGVYLSVHLFESTFWRTMETVYGSCGEPSVEAVLDNVGGSWGLE